MDQNRTDLQIALDDAELRAWIEHARTLIPAYTAKHPTSLLFLGGLAGALVEVSNALDTFAERRKLGTDQP